MIKGCFRIFVVLVIVSAVLYYVLDKYGHKIWESNKEEVVRLASEKLLSEFDGIDGENIDQVKDYAVNYFKNIDFSNIEENFNDIKEVIIKTEKMLEDKSISEEEFIELKEIFNHEE